MYYFIYLKLNIRNDFIIKQLFETIDLNFGKVIENNYFNDEYTLIIKNHFNKSNLKEYFENFLLENFLTTKVYISKDFTSKVLLEKELEIVSNIFNNNNFVRKHNVYYFKELLKDSLIYNNTIKIKKYILTRFYNNNDYELLLKTFFNNNLNVLKTARDLNMHRNTVIYRLDSFSKETDFDPRDFNDAFIIKLLIDY